MPQMSFPSHARQACSSVILSCCLAGPLALAGCGQSPSALGHGTHIAIPSPTWTPGQVVQTQQTMDASCPAPTPQPGITQPSLPSQGYAGAFVDNTTTVMPADQPRYYYIILAGNRKANPQQGLLIVQRFLCDPCAGTNGTPNYDTVRTYYDTPFQQGHVQLTGVVGDMVTFTTKDGGSTVHRFDFVTGRFL
jgi:hypothetical protein